MTFSEVAEIAFSNGPEWGRPFAKIAKVSILQCLFWAYFGLCSVFTLIIASSFQHVAQHYLGYDVSIRLCIAVLLLPLILISWIPNLKYLAPVSMIANMLMSCGLGIVFWYLFTDLPSVSERPVVGRLALMPGFFSITIFTVEVIGVVMPLENHMKTPQNFIGIFGVLNMGMTFVTLLCVFLGFFGYLRYGENTQGSITLNLPMDEMCAD